MSLWRSFPEYLQIFFDWFLACFFQLVDSSISFQSQLPQYSDEKRGSSPLVRHYFHFYSKFLRLSLIFVPLKLRFAASWTTLTAGAYTLLFVHPTWSKHPVSSVGSQAIWTFITWLFWVVGSGILNGSVPNLLDRGTCGDVVYCAQIRGLFGSFL